MHPEKLWESPGRRGLIAGLGKDEIAQLLDEARGLHRGPLVIPENGSPQRLVVGVQQHRDVCRTRERQRADAGSGNLPLAAQPPQCGLDGWHPFPRILLCPPRLRAQDRVRRAHDSEECAFGIHGTDLTRAGPDVDAQHAPRVHVVGSLCHARIRARCA